jgi:aminomethyltransferase
VKRAHRKRDSEIYMQVRNKMLKAKVIKKPFYSKKYKK